jgi:hypothetical protein
VHVQCFEGLVQLGCSIERGEESRRGGEKSRGRKNRKGRGKKREGEEYMGGEK